MTPEQVRSSIFYEHSKEQQAQLTPDWSMSDFIASNGVGDLDVDFCNGVAESITESREPSLISFNASVRMLVQTFGQPLAVRSDTVAKGMDRTTMYWTSPHDEIALAVISGATVNAVSVSYTAKGRARCIEKAREALGH